MINLGQNYYIWILIAILVVPLLTILFSFVFYFFYYLFRGFKIQKCLSTYKKRSAVKRIWLDFPNRFWLDRFTIDPNEFQEYGLHLFCGEQGCGKTVAVVELLLRLKQKYPKMRIRTNYNYLNQDESLETWQQLVKNENGVFGQAEVIDEIQTWFNSTQSKDFPPEMLAEISQQRKQRKMLIGTAQVFGRVAKPIREQTSFVYLPMTFAGCITVVRVSKPEYYSETDFKFKRYLKTYFFVHSEKLRDSFDTYKKIEGLAKAGFSPRPEFHNNQSMYPEAYKKLK